MKPLEIDASADFQVWFPTGVEPNKMELVQAVQEVSQKIERVSLPISIGVNDNLDTMPLKSIGQIENRIILNAQIKEMKNSIVDGDSGQNGLLLDTSLLNPLATYYETVPPEIVIGADVKSLSYLFSLRLIRNDMNVNASVIDFDLYRSLGKLSARIAVGADVSFFVERFIDSESGVVFDGEVETVPYKGIDPESAIEIDCYGTAILRRMRLLSEIDALGTLAEIDNMILDDLDYEEL